MRRANFSCDRTQRRHEENTASPEIRKLPPDNLWDDLFPITQNRFEVLTAEENEEGEFEGSHVQNTCSLQHASHTHSPSAVVAQKFPPHQETCSMAVLSNCQMEISPTGGKARGDKSLRYPSEDVRQESPSYRQSLNLEDESIYLCQRKEVSELSPQADVARLALQWELTASEERNTPPDPQIPDVDKLALQWELTASEERNTPPDPQIPSDLLIISNKKDTTALRRSSRILQGDSSQGIMKKAMAAREVKDTGKKKLQANNSGIPSKGKQRLGSCDIPVAIRHTVDIAEIAFKSGFRRVEQEKEDQN